MFWSYQRNAKFIGVRAINKSLLDKLYQVVITEVYDVVIIGAGIGGLSCGALLAKRGFKVLLLEQANKPGGYVGGFTREGVYFDAGVQSFSHSGIIPVLINQLGLEQEVKFKRVGFRFKTPAFDFYLEDCNQLKDDLVQSFPRSSKEINEFINYLKFFTRKADSLFQTLPGLFLKRRFDRAKTAGALVIGHLPFLLDMARKRKIPAAEYISGAFCTSELRAFLADFSWYRGVSTDIFLFILYSFLGDYWYPVRGMQHFSDTLAKQITELGGKVIYGEKVEKIVIESDKAVGVISGSRFYKGKVIISNADYKSTFGQLIEDKEVAPIWVTKLNDAPVSETNCTVFAGLKGTLEELGGILGTDHCFIFDQWEVPREDDPHYYDKAPLELTLHMPIERKLYGLSDGNNQITAGLVVQCVTPYQEWQRFNSAGREGYLEAKEDMVSTIWHRVKAHVPGIETKTMFVEGATPLTNQKYTLCHKGATAGFTWDPGRSWIKKKTGRFTTPIKNLYTVGQWSVLPGGVPSSVYSGITVANMVEQNLRSYINNKGST